MGTEAVNSSPGSGASAGSSDGVRRIGHAVPDRENSQAPADHRGHQELIDYDYFCGIAFTDERPQRPQNSTMLEHAGAAWRERDFVPDRRAQATKWDIVVLSGVGSSRRFMAGDALATLPRTNGGVHCKIGSGRSAGCWRWSKAAELRRRRRCTWGRVVAWVKSDRTGEAELL